MADEFLQMVVVVQLRNPPERLHGSVVGVEAGVSLTLSNVFTVETGEWQEFVVLDAANIAEIIDASKDPPLAPFSSTLAEPATSTGTPSLSDPAILSFKPRPGAAEPSRSPHGKLPQPSAAEDDSVDGNLLAQSMLTVSIQEPSRNSTPAALAADLGNSSLATAIAGPVEAASDFMEYNAPPSHPASQTTEKPRHRRKIKRSRAGRNGGGAGGDNAPNEAATPEQSAQAGRGKGWRETPMLQSTASFQPFNSLKKSGRRRQQPSLDNGWASEDVTDVQEMGDFDFEGGLAKFDKRTLFDQMRKEDLVDEADRLVAHNRRPKPGTAGGKNLHYTENVLDVPSTFAAAKALPKEPQTVSQDFWNSEADDGGAAGSVGAAVALPSGVAAVATSGSVGGGERLSGRELGSRQSSRRGEAKSAGMKRSQSRKASATTVGQGPSRVNSVAVPNMGSPTWGFYLVPSYRRIDTVSALQMLNLENIAHNELGLTEDMMTENAGRGVAEVALQALADPAIKIRTGVSDSTSPATMKPLQTVVILAGNNKSGTRAIAGGRHLRNKGVNVLVCVVGIERGERELLDDFRQQIRLYRAFGGRIYSKSELFEHLRKAMIPTLTIDTPRSAVTATPPAVTLIVDALLGLAVSFDELRTGDQASVYELIEWSNRNEAFVLAVDMPTGIDPSTGKATVIDGAPLYVLPRYVVAMGAPKRGLLEAVSATDVANLSSDVPAATDDPAVDWRLFVADIGFGAAVWKKAGTKIRRGIDFDDKWVLEMRYRGADGEEFD